jgi:hypothetical protein
VIRSEVLACTLAQVISHQFSVVSKSRSSD